MLQGQAGQFHRIFFIEAAHNHRVEFERLQPGLFGRQDAFPDILQLAPAGHAFEFGRVECVETHIDAVQPGGGQGRGQLREQHPIGGHGERSDARRGGNAPDNVNDVRPHGRFAPRQANFVEAQVCKHTREQQDLIVLQHFGIWPEGHIFRHAIYTAQITVICQADS